MKLFIHSQTSTAAAIEAIEADKTPSAYYGQAYFTEHVITHPCWD